MHPRQDWPLPDRAASLLFDNAESAAKKVNSVILRLKPQVVVMDVSTPVMNGLEATRFLKQVMPRVHVVLVSATYTPAEIQLDARNAGACLFLETQEIYRELVPAIVRACGLP